MDPNRREIFMNIPAARARFEQSFEVHGNVVVGRTSSAEYEHSHPQGTARSGLRVVVYSIRKAAASMSFAPTAPR